MKFLEVFKDRKKLLYWTEWTAIVVLHLILLKWILFVLGEGAVLTVQEMIMHFTGIGIYGALLIRGCAWIAQKRYEKSQQLKSQN